MNEITWLGHSTVRVDLDGVGLLTDPVLRSRVVHLRRVWAPDETALRDLDAALVSHLHFDHLDLPSLERLGRSLHVVVPRGAASLLRRRRFEHVSELDVGESLRIGAVTVRATFAEHGGSRLPLGRSAAALGFVVEGSQSVYFAGDTDLFDAMDELHATLDVALVPIWGWGPALGPGHLDPVGAAEALARLRPRIAVPIHWGTYYPLHRGESRSSYLRDAVRAFVQEAAARAPAVEIRVLEPNGRLAL